ncbi:MAG: M23 family metallopeptidase [Halopseudomonas aestusnigri]
MRDFSCGTLSYERHKGTDFRVSDYSLYHKGVYVIAAEDGVIIRARDGYIDGEYIKKGEEATKSIEEGNVVVLQHSDNWETLYAHLRKGSIAVKVGDKVKAGDILGVVGLSGKTEFTHLHFEVKKKNVRFDPFTGTEAIGCRIPQSNSFWNEKAQNILKYIRTGLIEAQFSSEIPDYKRLPLSDERSRIAIGIDADTLIYWIQAWGIKIADRITITYTDPLGKVSTNQKVLKENQALHFQYLGMKRSPKGWVSGRYVGKVKLERIVAGAWQIIFSNSSEITIPN